MKKVTEPSLRSEALAYSLSTSSPAPQAAYYTYDHTTEGTSDILTAIETRVGRTGEKQGASLPCLAGAVPVIQVLLSMLSIALQIALSVVIYSKPESFKEGITVARVFPEIIFQIPLLAYTFYNRLFHLRALNEGHRLEMSAPSHLRFVIWAGLAASRTFYLLLMMSVVAVLGAMSCTMATLIEIALTTRKFPEAEDETLLYLAVCLILCDTCSASMLLASGLSIGLITNRCCGCCYPFPYYTDLSKKTRPLVLTEIAVRNRVLGAPA